jgi:hypothetical protein
MSARSAKCPACGAAIEFANVATLIVVCSHCRYASIKKGQELEKIGLVAEVAPIESPIALRARGKVEDKRFEVVGQVQLDHGAGPWNEWNIVFESGESGWLAEAQGQYLVTFEAPAPDVPPWSTLRAGAQIDLGAHGGWVVAEKGRGKVTALRGELSSDLRPGSVVHYADLSGPDGGFGTLDYGAGETCEQLYLGVRRELAELELDTSGTEAPVRRTTAAERVECPKCAGAIELRDPANTQRVGCPYCGSLLDPRAKVLTVLAKSELFRGKPGPDIGAKGKLLGQDFEVLAHLERSVRAEGQRWPWDEYLLRRTDGAYRWLVCTQWHWSFVEPLNLADVKRGSQRAFWKGRTFKHFSGGVARVDRVVGEVYWEVAVGEAVRGDDYVDPPNMISFEETEDEKLVSLATYLERAEVQSAFGLRTALPAPSAIGPAQPNPVGRHLAGFWKTFGLLALLLLSLGLGLKIVRPERLVHESAHELDRPGAIVSEPFEIQAPPFLRTRASIAITAPSLETGGFSLEGLVESLDGATTRTFAITTTGPVAGLVESVAGGTTRVCVGGLSSGSYRLRLDPHPSAVAAAGMLKLRVTSGGTDMGLALLFLGLLLAVPVLLWFGRQVMEGARWSQSDHAE